MAGPITGRTTGSKPQIATGKEIIPRRIADVSVTLDQKIRTLEDVGFTVRDFLNQTVKSTKHWTTSEPEYSRAIDAKAGDQQVPRAFINNAENDAAASMIAVGPYVVLRPYFVLQPTVLDSGSKTKQVQHATSQQSTVSDFKHISGKDKGDTSECAAWKITGGGTVRQNQQNGGTDDLYIERASLQHGDETVEHLRTGLMSLFELKRNQPFGFRISVSQSQIDSTMEKLIGSDEFNNAKWSKLYPQNVRKQAALEIRWGAQEGKDGEFILVLRLGSMSANLYQMINGEIKEVSKGVASPTDAWKADGVTWQPIMIYPVGRQLIVTAGFLDSDTYEKNSFKIWFDEPVDIPPSKVSVYLYGSKINMQFCPVTHAPKGYFVSFPANFGLRSADPTYPALSYFGKRKAGRDEKKSAKPFPNNPDAVGEFDPQEAQHLPGYMKGQVQLRYEINTDGIESEIGKDAPEDVKKAIEKYPEPGAGGGQSFTLLKYVIEMKSHDDPKKRWYSPAIERMEVLGFPKFKEIDLSPDPQISHNDVMVVSVKESNQDAGATVQLDNRAFAERLENNGEYGKYTYDYSKIASPINNFTGIKPITIRGGIQQGTHFVSDKLQKFKKPDEAPDVIEQPIMFKGFVVSRTNSRPNSGSSVTTLTCEDVSRRAKDHITMNLPIFDGWCLSGDTRVLTVDGCKRIADLYWLGNKFDLVTSYQDGSKVMVKDCIAIKRGKKKVYRIVLKNGQSIKATEDHLFLLRNKNNPRYSCSYYGAHWAKLKYLSVGDEIKVNSGTVGRDFVSDGCDYGIDELLGWMVGDGYFCDLSRTDHRNGRVQHDIVAGIVFGKYDGDAVERLKPIWDSLTIKYCGQVLAGNTDDHGTTTYSSTRKSFIEYFKNLGFKPSIARDKTLPDYIWSASTQQQCAFLRGLFSADGSVIGAHGKFLSIELCSASLTLLEETQVLLSSLGMVSNIIHRKGKMEVLKNGTIKRWYGLEINGESVVRFMSHVGFNIKKKNNLFQPPQVPAKTKDFRQIMRIDELPGVDETYDISMPSIHAFYANGIYTHNCNLAAIYYLLRDAGYEDREMVVYRSLEDPDDVITLFDVLKDNGNDPHDFHGPCFEGHVDGFPRSVPILDRLGIKLDPVVVHSNLPLNTFREQPFYMFSAGQNTWDCLAAIREHTGFFLYPNFLGDIVYQPADIAFMQNRAEARKRGRTFVKGQMEVRSNVIRYYEMPKNDAGVVDGTMYNNFQRNLQLSVATQDNRNALALYGLVQPSPYDWTPQVIVKRTKSLQDDVAKPWFSPWLKWAIVKNPHWNNPAENAKLADELYKRLRRPMAQAQFGLWGQPGHHAYQLFEVVEDIMNETGGNASLYVTTGVEHNFDASKKTFQTNVTGELLDLSEFDFASHVGGNPGVVYSRDRVPIAKVPVPITPSSRGG